MGDIISVDKLADQIREKAAIKYAKLYGMDELSQFDKGYILAMNEVLNDLKYIEKIDL